MTGGEAEIIVNQYGGLIAQTPSGSINRKASTLPFSKALIKYAFFVYIETLVEMNALTQEVGYPLVYTYSLLSTFVDDDEAEKVNQLYRRANQNELDWVSHEGKIVQDAMRGVAGSRELESEINEFIQPCSKRHPQAET
jgi:hypothetical protein